MNSNETIWVIAFIATALALFATKPNKTEIDSRISEIVAESLSETSTNDATSALANSICSDYSSKCIKLIRSTTKLNTNDFVLWQSVKLSSDKMTLSCIGILSQVYCPGILNTASKRYAVCIKNELKSNFSFSYSWDDQYEHKLINIPPSSFSWFVSPKHTDKKLIIDYDKDYSEGNQHTAKILDANSVYIYTDETVCKNAKQYDVVHADNEIKLEPLN